MSSIHFDLQATDGRARAGVLRTPTSTIKTPVFMPVGTKGSVKGMTPEDLMSLGVTIILGNTYHLMLRPGTEVISGLGGLHKMMNWGRSILTDSGGYQVFSLSKMNKVTEEGVLFQSSYDGAEVMLTPEKSIEVQKALGSDIVMLLDECTAYPSAEEEARESMNRTIRWADRCKKVELGEKQSMFGIIQGGMHPKLREECVDRLVDIGFAGYAIGGLSVGEGPDLMDEIVDVTTKFMPKQAPRYLMGVGTPRDIVEAVWRGVDMFDCVIPTRHARNGKLYTSEGRLNISNSQYRLDDSPIDRNCTCYTCSNYSRGYLRHLYQQNEILASRLNTLHNINYYIELTRKIRESICSGTFARFYREFSKIPRSSEDKGD